MLTETYNTCLVKNRFAVTESRKVFEKVHTMTFTIALIVLFAAGVLCAKLNSRGNYTLKESARTWILPLLLGIVFGIVYGWAWSLLGAVVLFAGYASYYIFIVWLLQTTPE